MWTFGGIAMKTSRPPLVYSCSGCSNAAQMANQMALWLDCEGEAEMSCIAGVGGASPGCRASPAAAGPSSPWTAASCIA